MKKSTKIALAALITAPLTLSAVPAFADSVGGGTWNWGNTLGWNYSDYLHPDNDHSSTVICGDSTDRDIAVADEWSNAGLWAVSGCGFWWSNAI